MTGHLSIVLHAHLPFVRHPEHEEFLEEDWFYEALTETYLPLLAAFRRLRSQGIFFRLTLSLSPPLMTMLRDDLLLRRYARRLDRLCQLAEKECRRLKDEPRGELLAEFYLNRFHELNELFHITCRRDVVGAFGDLMDSGHLELITCGATHGLLPLYQFYPSAVRAQVSIAAQFYRETFGRPLRGIWLPECGYFPGLDSFLADEDIGYFILDSHGLLDASPRPRYGVYAPIITPSGVAAFGRDGETSQQVWSAQTGYPGDEWYREFYRDIGYDLDLDYIRPHIQPTGERKNTGIKYHRITDRLSYAKDLYDRPKAMERTRVHAEDFVLKRQRQLQWLSSVMKDQAPIVVAPYDAELFGHWWFEGPDFLENVLKLAAAPMDEIRLSSPSDYLCANTSNQWAQPPMCTWGEGGYLDVWVNDTNDWIYRHIFKATERMIQLANTHENECNELHLRALNQATRELLLAQASDWAFIMKAGTMKPYAVQATKEHLLRFTHLYDALRTNQISPAWLAWLESQDNVFPHIDYRIYRNT